MSRIAKRRQVRRKTAFKCKVSKCNWTLYSVEQKEVVVNYAKKYGRNSAAAHFGLNKSMVRRWVKACTSWNEISRNSKKVGSGRKAFFPEAERKLYS